MTDGAGERSERGGDAGVAGIAGSTGGFAGGTSTVGGRGDRASERALARASAVARKWFRESRRVDRAARSARMLRGLEQSLFGSGMPDATVVVLAARWQREAIDAACPRCGTTLSPFEDTRRGCAECRGRRLPYERFVRLGRYAPPLSQWVPAVKGRAWRGMGELLGAELGRQTLEAFVAEGRPLPDLVTAIPTHWTRRLLRGIDHGACLAGAAARVLSCDHAQLLAARLGWRQTGAGKSLRVSNAGRFELRAGRAIAARIEGSRILLVDDVRTTGSTLREAAALLRGAGASSVSVACCAAVDPPSRSAARFAPPGRPSRMDP